MRKKRPLGVLLRRARDIYRHQGFWCTVGIILTYFIEDSYLGRLFVKLRYGRTGLVLRTIQGSKMYLQPTHFDISTELAVKGVHEPAATREFLHHLKPGMRIVDLGANIGYYTLLEARAVGPQGRIYAVEPDPATFEILQRNIEVNGYQDRVQPFQMAIADRSGEARLYQSQKSNLNSLLPNPEDDETFKVIQTTTLDQFVKDFEPIDFIRMDVEGFEHEILLGADRTFSSEHPIQLFMEVHDEIFDERGLPLEAFFEQLANYGFKPIAAAKKWSPAVLRGLTMAEMPAAVRSGGCHVFLKK